MGADKKEFILELLAGIGEIRGRTKLQKIIFLGQKELGLREIFDFDEYYYGPYAQDLTSSLDELVSEGKIIEDKIAMGDYIQYSYKLAPGYDSVSSKYIPETTMSKLCRLAKMPRSRIIDYVYRKYLPHRI
ncbi:MAG: uncharacterized protein PWQ51_1720 [Methanolobus sp.]|uniref:Antitoxin SocA-like Panacea domain-containing protein n=1 Tax=Methanolobus tindarius DSM 2278 TaxID=1090322 RepID=W9DXT5_METTI|nr:hypothetical protein [Methanolobus tindarius]ETA68512.1 hypothetical protein MettiDRAFT_1985 [Methanolobus tindarius DSM 2278]MDI3485203.1 uncharacterized protein [Methanolobus sp.]MDK2939555.1 uncharacterized protein [Methanolobus sp.]